MSISPSIQSMTGFGSASVEADGVAIRADLRSVNGKGFDIRLRLPPGLDDAEGDFRKQVNAEITRGNLQLAISVDQSELAQTLSIDEALFAALAQQATDLAAKAGLAPPSADAILQMRGVVTAQSDNGLQMESGQLKVAALEACDGAITQLLSARKQEGVATAKVMMAQVDEIEMLISKAATDPATKPDIILAKLTEQVSHLVADNSLDPQRLHTEAALLATKADIREELDRLTAHIASARGLFAEGGAIGRKLEFLCQEFNREANTLCSKSPSASLTEIGLAMKAVIDQMREQSANIA